MSNKLLVVIFIFSICFLINGLRGLTNELEKLNSRIDKIEMFLDLDLNAEDITNE